MQPLVRALLGENYGGIKMGNNTTTIKGLEQGRAKFAYECANQVLSLKEFRFNQKHIDTNKILKKMFQDKFKQNIKSDENEKVLDEFLENPLQKIEEYSSSTGFERKILDFYEKIKKEYKSYVKKIPMLIKTNGLGATFAFMLSKRDTYKFIGEQILEWLKNDEKGILPNAESIKSFEDLNKKVASLNSPEYRALTIEVLVFFNWLRRFAEGLIEGDEQNE